MIRKLAYIDSFTSGIRDHLVTFGTYPPQTPDRRHELTATS